MEHPYFEEVVQYHQKLKEQQDDKELKKNQVVEIDEKLIDDNKAEEQIKELVDPDTGVCENPEQVMSDTE